MALSDAIATLNTDLGAARTVLHGTSSQTVVTDNGTIKSLAKNIADNDVLASTSETARLAGYTALKNQQLSAFALLQTDASTSQTAASSAIEAARVTSAAALQDVAGFTTSLHRTPGTVANTFVYDTSRDSDGGVWADRAANTSWFNETLNANWLGSKYAEFDARATGGTKGAEILPQGFATGWNVTGGATVASNSTMTLTGINERAEYLSQAIVPTKVYEVTVVVSSVTGAPTAQIQYSITSGWSVVNSTNPFTIAGPGTYSVRFNASDVSASGFVRIIKNSAIGSMVISSVSLKEITAFSTKSGDYYQLNTDGKFYTLSRNLFKNSQWTGASGALGSYPTGWGVLGNNGNTALAVTEIVNGVSTGVVKLRRISVTGFEGLAPPTLGTSMWQTAFGISVLVRVPTGVTAPDLYTYDSQGQQTVIALATTLNAQPKDVWVSYSVSITPNNSIARTNIGFALNQAAIGTGVDLAMPSLEIGAVTTYDPTIPTQETFRGNKAKPPRMWGVVVETARVVIYDLLEAGCPMWMVFTSDGNSLTIAKVLFNSLGPVWALNGKLVIGSPGGASLRIIDFAKDTIDAVYNSTTLTSRFGGGIAQRNSNLGFFLPSTYGAIAINSSLINAVAMSVMPDAPVDPVTNLQVPTIAVATSTGVSVIKHDNTVVSSSATSAQNMVTLSPYLLTCSRNFSNVDHFYALSPGKLGASFALLSAFNDSFDQAGIPAALTAAGRSGFAKISGSKLALRVLNENASIVSGVAPHLSANIAPTYNTGWIAGDVRRVLLCDTIPGFSSAPEQITNGTFNTDTSGWVATVTGGATGFATLSAVGGAMRITNDATGTHFGCATFGPLAVTPGKSYQITWQKVGGTIPSATGAQLHLGTAGGGGVTNLFSNIVGVAVGGGTANFTFIAPVGSDVTGIYITLSNEGNNAAGYFTDYDNVSFKEVVAERSYKAKPSSIVGTLTKTAVGAGSQLVAYSGFSAANYARESYSADLDFGTAGFDVMSWVNMPAVMPQFPTGAELRASGAAALIGTATAASYDTSAGSGSVTRGVDVNNQSYVSFSGLAGTYWVSLTNTGTNIVLVRAGGSGGSPFLSVSPGQTLAGHVPSQSGLISITSGSGASTFTGVSIKQESPCYVFERSAAAGSYYRFGTNADGTLVGEVYDGTTIRTVTSPTSYAGLGWILPELSLSSTGSLTLKVNGIQAAQTTGAALLTLNNAAAVLTLGNNFALTAPFPGSIALVRISATIPTAEQTSFAYTQEVKMFADGAQVTLPDSSSLLGVDYDPVFDQYRLVSTTGYETLIQGLVRVAAALQVGTLGKIAQRNGYRLMSRTVSAPSVDVTVPSVPMVEQLSNKREDSTRIVRHNKTFDFDAIAAQTDFVLPVGWETMEVLSAGTGKREGSTKDWIRLWDGFKETIRFATAPGAAVWVQIVARQLF